jgi:hypothetical protein
MKRIKQHIPFVLLSSFFFIFFHRQIFFDEVLYCCDNLLINIPAKIFWAKRILSGELPLINPYLFSGSPFLADINLSPLYPGNIFFLVFEPFAALTGSVLFHFFIASVGAYWMSIKLGLENKTAAIVSTLFVFSGTMIGYTGNLPMIQVASILPWLFGSWVVFCKHPSKKYFGIIVILSALQIFAGHIQLTYYSFVFCFLYAALFMARPVGMRFFLIALIAVCIAVLASPQLIPFVDVARHSTRMGSGFSYSVFGALAPYAIIRFIFPGIVGNLSQGTDWWQAGSMYGYIGAIPMMLAIMAMKNAQNRAYFFGIVGAIAFLAAFGENTFVFPILYYTLPGVSLFRVPAHFLLIATFSFAILAGIAVEKRIHARRFLFMFSGALGVLWIALAVGKPFLIREIYHLDHPKIVAKLEFLGNSGIESIFSDVQNNILFLAASLFIFYVWTKHGKKTFWMVAALLFFLDLFFYSRMNLLTIPRKKMMAWQKEQNKTVSEILRVIEPGYRFYVHPSLYQSPYQRKYKEKWIEEEVLWQMRMFRPNMLMNYDIPMVDGYASMIDQRYQNIFGVPSRDPTGVTIPDTAVDKLQRLNVRYVLFPAQMADNPLLPHLRLVWSNAYIRLYEFPAHSKSFH